MVIAVSGTVELNLVKQVERCGEMCRWDVLATGLLYVGHIDTGAHFPECVCEPASLTYRCPYGG